MHDTHYQQKKDDSMQKRTTPALKMWALFDIQSWDPKAFRLNVIFKKAIKK